MTFTKMVAIGWLHRIEARLVQEHGDVATSVADDSIYVTSVLDVVVCRIQLEREKR